MYYIYILIIYNISLVLLAANILDDYIVEVVFC